MLVVNVPGTEFWDEANERFVTSKPMTLHLEHSLYAMSKWESKYEKRFLSREDKTPEEFLYYVWCMSSDDISPDDIKALPVSTLKQIEEYMGKSCTAKRHRKRDKRGSRPIATDDIYGWMVGLQIPFECQYWHINRLLELVNICSRQNGGGKKMSKGELYNYYDELNNARRKKYHTTG